MNLKDRIKARLIDPLRLSVPEGTAAGPTDLSLYGRGCVEIEGCVSITEYKEDAITVTVKEGPVSICGTGLCLRAYGKGRIAICGKIERIVLDGKEGAQNDF